MTEQRSHRDTTLALDRKTGELAGSRALVRATLDATADAVCVTDPIGKITDYNRKFLDMWKIARKEVDTCEYRQTRARLSAQFADPAGFEARLEQIYGEAPGQTFDLLTLHDGREIERVSNMQVVDGHNAGRVWSFRDITDARRRERRTAELEAANGDLESFSYSLSHDLRAPLRAVDGFSQAVLEDFGAQLPEEARRYLLTIRQGTQQMGLLIDDLLKFALHGRIPLHKRRVEMLGVVQSALDEVDSQRAGRHIDIKIGALPACSGDPALLKQVWINLLSNAFKYTRRCDPAMVEIGCKAMLEGSVYFISDNGAGFDMRYAEKLFGVFQRLHRAEDYEGSGVGLAIVHRVIQRHGGRIWANARVGGGATFYFTLGEELKK